MEKQCTKHAINAAVGACWHNREIISMSSKVARRRAGYKKREERRQRERDRQKAIREAKDIESLARAMGVKLR
jgi:hypothetical protein